MQWQVLNDSLPHNLAELRQLLLTSRQITDENAFFHPSHPRDLTLEEVGIDRVAVQRTIERLQVIRKSHAEIVVFGDYDADGISATTIMWQTLHALGLKATPFIPHREKHGYGLSHRALDDILAQRTPAVIMTVDNGIVAHGPAQRLKEAGVDLIITDHHLPEATLPPAYAIVHSTKLCGATVSWMLAREIATALAEISGPTSIDSALDLGGLATIADQVPLQGANRSFATHGITALRQTKRVGLLELMQQANLTQSALTVNNINFVLAPRINAMGRLEHGMDALRLLCTNKVETAQKYAGILADTNTRRQDLTYEMVEDAKRQAETWADEHIIIVHSETYHDGVIGLIAGKLMEEYYKPAIVISVNGQVAKASARSIPGVNIVELIREVKSDLLEAGGHPMAAGFGLEKGKLETVIIRLRQLAKQTIEASRLVPKITVDTRLPLDLVNLELADFLHDFEPFGQGNPTPVFGLSQVKVLDAFTMGKEHTHLKVVVSHPEATSNISPVYAIGWGLGHLASTLPAGTLIDLAGSVEINEYKGKRSVQVMIKDLVISP